MKGCDTDDFIPYNEEQKMLSLISEHTGGSPDIIDVTSTMLAKRLSKGDVEQRRSTLQEFCVDTCNVVMDESERNEEASKLSVEQVTSSMVSETVAGKKQLGEEESCKQSTVVRFTTKLLENLKFSQSDYCLLLSLHWFGPIPIPRAFLQSMVMSASKHQYPSRTPFTNLLSSKLLRVYPSTVIVKSTSLLPCTNDTLSISECIADYYYVPQLIIDSIKGQMEPVNRNSSLTAAFKALEHYCKESNCDLTHAAGLANVLSTKVDEQTIYQEIYAFYSSLKH